jgi:hypothetical protein
MADVRFPIGPFMYDPEITSGKRSSCIAEIRRAPEGLRRAITGLGDGQLDTPYREGGWTVRQVVHHLVDSHLNAYVRFRWTLTEDRPSIKVYHEKSWAELPDARAAPPGISVALLEALHARWVMLLESMGPGEFGRMLTHPEHGDVSLDRMLQLYAWHGRHHVAHIEGLRAREGW